MKKSDSYKIIYHFNRFVFSIFKKNQKSHKAANKQLILTSKRNIVLPGTVVANVVKTNENEKQNNNNLDEDFFKQGNDDPDNFDLDNFNLDEIDFEALKKDKPDYKEKKTNEDIIIDDDLIEEITEPLENVLSKYVSYNIETREFIAKIYGFVILNDKKIEILPLTWYTEDKLNAYHYIYPGSDNQFPTLSDIKKIIDTEKIVHFLDDQTIKNQLEAIQKDPQKVGESILIGKGTNPQNGFVERFELKKNQPAEISSITENSKTDYQEKEYFDLPKKKRPFSCLWE